MISRFKKIDKNLYRGGKPSVKDLRLLKEKFGIERIISLDAKIGKAIDRICKLLGLEHIIIDLSTHRKSTLLNLLKYNLNDLFLGKKTFIHCLHGKDRTGLLSAIYRCKYQNWSYDKAIKEAKKLGFGIGVDPKIIKLYTNFIKLFCNSEDINEAYDIVNNVKDEVGMYGDFIPTNMNPSWAPFEDARIIRWPDGNTENYYSNQYQNRLNYKLDDAINMDIDISENTIPNIGVWDQNQGINGLAPSSVGTGCV